MQRTLAFWIPVLFLIAACGKPQRRLRGVENPIDTGATTQATLVIFGAPPCSNCHRDFPEIQHLLDAVPAAQKDGLKVKLYVETGTRWTDPPSPDIAARYRDSLHLSFAAFSDGIDSHGRPSYEIYTRYTKIPLQFAALPAGVLLDAKGAVTDIFQAGGTTFVPQKNRRYRAPAGSKSEEEEMKRAAWLMGVLLIHSVANAAIAPSFQGETLTGDRVSLKGLLKEKRALLLCFWATWCVPCIEEMRQVAEKLKAQPDLALDVVAVNVDTSETTSDVKPIIRQYGFTFPMILDPKHEIFSRYQQDKSLPFSALISSGGKIEKTFSGYHDEMFAEVKRIVGPSTEKVKR